MSQNNPFRVRVNFGNGAASEPPPLTPQQQQARALAIARTLEPKKVVGFEKIRIGRDRDGGYIHVNDFGNVGAALSFGIGDDVSWDLDIAAKSIPVYQFDHTIERAPTAHPLHTFQRQRIAATDAPGCVSLDTLAKRLLANCERALLKIDIEGDEFAVFNATSHETLAKFSQIVCEFHHFQFTTAPIWSQRCLSVMKKLKEVFEVVHVHANNAMSFTNVGNVVLPELLEITFANKAHYQFAETCEIFPTAIDRPNLPDRLDLWLGCFKF